MKLSPRQRLVVGVVTTLLACVLLQVAFSLFYWLPERSVRIAAKPSLDVIVIVGGILIGTSIGRLRGRGRRALLAFAPIVVGACVLLGVAQGIALREFGYNFTLAYHTDKVHALFKMMFEAQSLLVFTMTMALLAGTIALLVVSAAWALGRLIHASQHSRQYRMRIAVGLMLYAVIAGIALGTNGSMILELTSQLDEVIHREERIMAEAKRMEKKITTIKRLRIGENLRRPTVLVFVVESYGQILMEAGKYEEFRSFLAVLESSLVERGYAMRSNVYEAPVFGGSSWLANASILCRLMVAEEKMYFSLMETTGSCLPAPFNEAGYHSVFAASNTIEIDEEYRRKFPFETFLTKDELDYAGPRMSWSYMPDQYLIDIVERRILRKPSDRAHFVYYKLTSSHHPWDTIPPYIEDWDAMGDGSLFHERKGNRFPDNEFIGGEHYNEGYEAAVRYSLRTVVEYLGALPEDRDVLAIVLGDHQPRRPVAIMDRDPWTVPYHVISRDQDLVERFSRMGYTPGLLTQTPDGASPGLNSIASHIIRGLNDVTEYEATVYK